MKNNFLKDPYKIGVLGLSKGDGAGFLASSLARLSVQKKACRPAVAELGAGGLYDSLGMDKRFAGKDYFSFTKAAFSEQSLRGKRNEYLGVHWILVPPEDRQIELSYEQKLRIVANAVGDPVYYRFSGVPQEQAIKLLWEMDLVLLVIDPLPSKLLPAYHFLCELRKVDIPICYIINKWNVGVDRRELLQYLQIKEPFYIPAVPQEFVYGAEYACRPLIDMPSAQAVIKESIEKISQEIAAFSG
ncbi:MAG: hypothetical protein PHQ50_03690 [Eubacteriales bacterium]|nr:hypothetical protein [Eubacteriales bacterium]MDD3350095.1 hypothetical protein [Eubacteriales bacterium]